MNRIAPHGDFAEEDEANGTMSFVLRKQKNRAVMFVNGNKDAHYFPLRRDADKLATITCILKIDGCFTYSKSFRSEKKAIEWCKKESGAVNARE